MKTIRLVMLGFFLLLSWLASQAATNRLLSVESAEGVQDSAKGLSLIFRMAEPVSGLPESFVLQDGARLVVDFAHTQTALPTFPLQAKTPYIDGLRVVQAADKVRAVFTFIEPMHAQWVVKGSVLELALTPQKNTVSPGLVSLENARFERDDVVRDAGVVVLRFSDHKLSFDRQTVGGQLRFVFSGVRVPGSLKNRYDVNAFGTLLKQFSIWPSSGGMVLGLDTENDAHVWVYQVNRELFIQVQPIATASSNQAEVNEQRYHGEKITLDFQDVKVRSVLQLLAQFTGRNVVVSDQVAGNMTLRLSDVPWDQALDIILRTQNLAKREVAGIMMIDRADILAAREKAELQNEQDVQKLVGLRSELIALSFANAASVSNLLKSKTSSVLSDRGTVTVDERTNTLWVQDSPDKLREVRDLVTKLDIPVRQVLIEARVVSITKDAQRALGVRFGVSGKHVSGTLEGATDQAKDVLPSKTNLASRLIFNRPSKLSNSGSLAIALAHLGSDVLLDLELSALETESAAEIISSPRLITSNQSTAHILQGEEIPFEAATASGATSVAFREAVLRLEVTPQITPDHRIMMDLFVTKDERGDAVFDAGPPAITKREVRTRVLVEDGETIVLGGIFEREKHHEVDRIPFFGEIPLLGNLFKRQFRQDKRTELLVFVTPRLIDTAWRQKGF